MHESKKFTLRRQDENGVEYVVEAFDEKEKAQEKLGILEAANERKPHKQRYWID